MPLNVVDSNNKHLGFVARTYPRNYNLFLVAITDEKIEDIGFNYEVIKDTVATKLDCKNLIGKIKEDKFENTLKEMLRNDYSNTEINNFETFIKYLFLKNPYAKTTQYIEHSLNIKVNQEKLKGYIVLHKDFLNIRGENIIINDEIDYIEGVRISHLTPILGKVIDYPIHRTNIMKLGEGILLGANWSDFGGRNHAHTTRLTIKSGDFIWEKLDIPIYINVKKGMTIQVYIEGDDIKQIFCDEVIYVIE